MKSQEVKGARAFAEWVRHKGIVLDQLMVAEPTLCVPSTWAQGWAGDGIRRAGVRQPIRPSHTWGQNAIASSSTSNCSFGARARAIANSTAHDGTWIVYPNSIGYSGGQGA